MAVSSQERHNKLCVAWYNFLVWLYRYRLIRITNLGNTDVVNILSLPQRLTWSTIELNDGSWEFGLPLRHVGNFQKLVRKVSSNAKIDVEYNPLLVPIHDDRYFESFPRARIMNGIWLEERVKRIYGAPKEFYMDLVCIQKWIAEELSGHIG
uniref:Superkiller protein 3 n=1 Tax=Talaromyces marneffei PM1 TaxID=1077442 RepID=A0A093UXY8_TALMA